MFSQCQLPFKRGKLNARTAKLLGLSIPNSILIGTDEVIE
jgi:hypothetical protein